MASWPGPIAAVTLFAEDLAESKRFYSEVFDLPVHFEDDDSVVFRFGDTVVNLLAVSEAPGLIAPATVAGPQDGSRMQFTLAVDDVDAAAQRLRDLGVALVSGPVDRPWGIRTATFADPSGHLWELAR